MLFTTLEFLGFIAVLLLVFYLVPKKYQWLVLLCASLAFYMGLGRRRVIFILASAFSTWIIAILLEKLNGREKAALSQDKTDAQQSSTDTMQSENVALLKENLPQTEKTKLTKEDKTKIKKQYRFKKRILLAVFLFVNLGGLLFFKFYNMLAESSDILPALRIIMPAGISFYTLQIIGYIMDVYNKKVTAEKNLLKVTLFTTYFPQIIQGPISRFDKLQVQLTAQHNFDYDKFVLGLLRMLWGYFKKLVIADRFAIIVAPVFDNPSEYAGFQIIMVAFFYTIQLYADFSGGIDIALGVSELFGVVLPENFNRPFFSKSIGEFWRRWHITLGTWLRDYVFYPVTLSKPLARLGKMLSKNAGKWYGKWIPAYISLFILWFCSGVWHGEGSQFVLYGMYHGCLIMLGLTLEVPFGKMLDKFKVSKTSETLKFLRVARTFSLVCIGEIIFRASSAKVGIDMIKSIFYTFNPWVIFDGFIYTLGIDKSDFYVGSIAIAILLFASLQNRKMSMRQWIKDRPLPLRWVICLGAIMAVVIFGVYGPGYDAVPFIYFKF